ncbi:MAG: AAA family ATPase [Alphaproteobacteria bacterium]|nr:AAA family ATPase [Alphaproteobacteria bacterium]NCQ88685.1 AAA family ATPase [Alphaproteobacteria bacterium]NCT08218.1 AAA family ATPase [Alphaproteobacteria bacterium]
MQTLDSAKIKYIQSLLYPKAPNSNLIKDESGLVNLAKDYAKKSSTPETDFILGYFGLFYGDEYKITKEQAIAHIEKAHDSGNQDATAVLAQIYRGDFTFLNDDYREKYGEHEFISNKAKYLRPSKGLLLLEGLALSSHKHGMYLYASYYGETESYDDDSFPRYRHSAKALEFAARCKQLNYIGGYYLEGIWLFGPGPGKTDTKSAFEVWKEGYEKAEISDLFSIPIYHTLCYCLGYCYIEGEGITKDEAKGLELIKTAADGGHDEAIEWLEHYGSEADKIDIHQDHHDVSAHSPMQFFVSSDKKYVFEKHEHLKEINESELIFSEKIDIQNNRSVEDANGYHIIKHPEDDYKPPIRVRIHQPEAKQDIYDSYLNESDEKQKELMSQLLEPIDKLPGLENIKEEVRSIIDYAFITKKREEYGLKSKTTGMHMMFLGNPGTGKTHIARLLVNIFYQIGVLKKGHVVEADQSVLTGEYIGWSASKTNLACHTALDGILFIDEAYSLTDNQWDYGSESVTSLMKFMEDFNERFIVIAAGYKDKMEEFVRSNPGLRSRFALNIEFKDYKPEAMVAIFKIFAAESDYILNSDAEKKLLLHLKSIKGNDIGRFANARGVRHLFDATIKKQSGRLIKNKITDKESMMEIKPEDIPSDKTIDTGNVTYLPNSKDKK